MMRTGMRIVASLAGSLVLSTLIAKSAYAEEIGRIEFNGAEIILNDDNTWEYGSAPIEAASNCTEITSEVLPISICLDPEKWTFADLGGEAEHKLRMKNEELYLLFITEKTFVTIPNLKKAAIANAQSASGLTKVKTLLDGSAIVDGKAFGKINYATTVNGVDVTYSNYATNFDNEGSVQLVFFAGQDQFDGFASEIGEAIAGVQIRQ